MTEFFCRWLLMEVEKCSGRTIIHQLLLIVVELVLKASFRCVFNVGWSGMNKHHDSNRMNLKISSRLKTDSCGCGLGVRIMEKGWVRVSPYSIGGG
jgi:hypothetical protein